MAETIAASSKPVHTIVLDAGPILKNTPPLSTLLAQCDEIITTPSVVSEIRDPDARLRVETLYLPFLKQRSPTPKSFNIISEFARKTGDRSVLSRTDIEVLALAYEIECEKNEGDWRLRSVPGQKRINGKPPVKEETEEAKPEDAEVEAITEGVKETTVADALEESPKEEEVAATNETEEVAEVAVEVAAEEDEDEDQDADEADSDGGEWITPSNYKKRLAEDESGSATLTAAPKTMQVATMTTDFAVSTLPHNICPLRNCLSSRIVSKRTTANEPQPSVYYHPSEDPASSNLHQALPRLFLDYKGVGQAVLPSLRQGHSHPCLMHDHCQRRLHYAFEEEHAVEQARQCIQRSQARRRQFERQVEGRRWPARMGY
jgi:rRNA maturation endonuclease Nob1